MRAGTLPHRLGLLLALLLLLSPASRAAPTTPAAERADTYAEALDRAKLTGRDIVVFQHGSDWNRLGERLLADVWSKPEFAQAVGTGVILVAVDQPETVGNPPVAGHADASIEASYTPPASPVTRLRERCAATSPLPACEITALTTSNGTVFAAGSNGAWLASGPNPAQEILTAQVKTAGGGRLLRLDFPLDDSLPGRGPGRASNGNFALSEVEVLDAAGAAVRADAAWANASEGAWGAWQAIDGISDKPESVWNAYGHQHQPRTLLLALAKPLAAGASFTVRISCRSQWGQHSPGTLRAAIVADEEAVRDVLAVGAAERLNAGNARFTWRGDDVPRVAYMDAEGRPVFSEDRPRLGLTPAALAARVRELRALRVRRDELWARAEKESGPAKAELLMRSLDLLQLGGWPGHENCYKFVHDQIRAADSNDVSGVQRWLEFQTEPRQMPALVNPANKLAGEKKYAEAIALLDAELKAPANAKLTKDHLQRIMMAKYHLYRQWPDHDAERLNVLREIAALDPTTYLGIGATGYLAMFHKNPEPCSLTYGWATNHVRAGANRWTFGLGTTNYFDHTGRYTLRIVHNGGADTITVARVSLVAGATVISHAEPAAALKPGGKVEVPLELPASPPPAPLAVVIDYEAAADHTAVAGRFEVDPLL